MLRWRCFGRIFKDLRRNSGGGRYKDNDEENSCLIFSNGAWKWHGKKLLHPRLGHGSWTRKDGVLLIGGVNLGYSVGSRKTTEFISNDGVHRASFDLNHPTL